ncbi:MAG: hypothetical protein C0P75_012455 [Bacilli bacterium]|uniref:Uncharacterized protein n=1 Tax=Ureibacillus suwonensis TaxID=313007 RepID=A0ABW0RC96_9BACL|nr:hypothetical protein [Bacilli bacterium]
MDIKKLILCINGAVDALEYATARKYIEQNLDIVDENRHLLNSNAREILQFVKDNLGSSEQPLTKKEMNIITVINTYAKKLDVRGLKLYLKEKEKEQLLQRKNVLNILNADAKILLTSLGFIKGKEIVNN